MLSNLFLSIFILAFVLTGLVCAFAFKIVYKKSKTLNGKQTLFILGAVLLAIFMVAMAGSGAYESHLHMEYATLMQADPSIDPNPHTYYSIGNIIMKYAACFMVLFGIYFSHKKIEKKRLAEIEENLKNPAHQGWSASIKSHLNDKRG